MTAVKPPLDSRSEKLKIHTNEIVRRMFVATADGNYIVARLAFFHQLPFDFYWLSLHALEKYYKAILLMNGRPVLQYKHHLAPLHQAVLDLDPRLPIGELIDPQIGHLRWIDETMDAWLARLDRFGAADNRYATYGYYLCEDDLFKVDQHVWNVRRCCRLFLEKLARNDGTEIVIDNVRELVKNKKLWKGICKWPLEELASLPSGNRERAAFLSLNVPFRSGRKPSLRSRQSMSHSSPFTDWLRLLRASANDPSLQNSAPDVVAWAVDHIRFSRKDERQLRSATEDYTCARAENVLPARRAAGA